MGETYQVTLTEEEYKVLKEHRKEQTLNTIIALKERKVIKKPKRIDYAGGTYTEIGELKVIEEEAVKPQYRPKGGFFMCANVAMRKLATMGLQGNDHRVLFYMLAEMDWSNRFRVPLKKMAEDLGMQKQNISRSIGNLMHFGLLEEVKTGTPYKAYDVNMQYFVKGYDSIHWSNQGLEYPPPSPREQPRN